ncbi:CLUMA_CG006419, isoform A [Clunio marinus]|uniref:CLUMA_CG006419, isoform A n=1 Tax=Clunio marinus TaxID=568069 RepID=A0A1J1I1F7_9DIPT|nr:CLUMA_CG006419, isoform A [Clunio marinus]
MSMTRILISSLPIDSETTSHVTLRRRNSCINYLFHGTYPDFCGIFSMLYVNLYYHFSLIQLIVVNEVNITKCPINRIHVQLQINNVRLDVFKTLRRGKLFSRAADFFKN